MADVVGLVARMRGPLLMARENGRFIPYYDVANNGPAPHLRISISLLRFFILRRTAPDGIVWRQR